MRYATKVCLDRDEHYWRGFTCFLDGLEHKALSADKRVDAYSRLQCTLIRALWA